MHSTSKSKQLLSFSLGTPMVIILSLAFGISATLIALTSDTLLAYGDAESHLNIAKRVVDSLTPGLAQLGGIWLPLPHLFLVPFVSINWLWRTGLAGSLVSGLSYLLTSLYLYRLILRFTPSKLVALMGFLIFALNPNILYLQTTAMTELPLLAFFTASFYYLVKYLQTYRLPSLILSALFGLAATLTRYDGWLLVLMETAIILFWHLIKRRSRQKFSETEGKVILFATLAFVGIVGWLLWDFLILHDPLYFTNSPFSAKSQQQSWLSRGELPAYGHPLIALIYYLVTAAVNIGYVWVGVALLGMVIFNFYKPSLLKFIATLLFLVPLIFNSLTLYLGQSVIFIPNLTPASFEWRLFNVRYGVMLIPAAAFYSAYLFGSVYPRLRKTHFLLTLPLLAAFIGFLGFQSYLFVSGQAPIVSYEDGVHGLSAAKRTDAQNWLKANYDDGYILVDDFARTTSIIRSNLPMDKVIYVGTKPYWEESLKTPQKYARWIIMQEGDTVWQTLYENAAMQGQLYAHFQKVYTSPTILIFRQTPALASNPNITQ